MVKRAKSTKADDTTSAMNVEERKLVTDSFEMISQLNSQIGDISKSKVKLQKDIKALQERIKEHEGGETKIPQSKLLTSIKEEVLRDFAPLLEKFNFKDMRVDVFKEISKLVDLEVDKLRAEFSTQNEKSTRNIKTIISDLEIRLVDSLRDYAKLKKDFQQFEAKDINDLFKNLENKVEQTIAKTLRDVQEIVESKDYGVNEIKDDLIKYQQEIKSGLAYFKKSKTLFDKELKSQGITHTALESKVEKLVLDIDSLKSLVSRYEDDLYTKEKRESLEIEKKVKSTLEKSNKLIEEYQKIQKSQEKLLKDEIKNFQGKLVDLEKKNFDKYKEGFEKETKKYLEGFVGSYQKELFGFKEQFSNQIKSLEEISNQGDNLAKQKIVEIESKLNQLDGVEKNFENFVALKYNEMVDSFEKLKKQVLAEQETIQDGLKGGLQERFSEEFKGFQEQLAGEIIKLKEFMISTATQVGEAKRDLGEGIEERFFKLKEEYENNFAKKEDEFLAKLNVIELEKKKIFTDLEDFKKDVAMLTKNFSSELDLELKSLRKEEANFEEKKKEFLLQVDNISHVRSIQLNEEAKAIETRLRGIVEDVKSKALKDDESFKVSFNTKIQGLRDAFEQKLESIEKRFVEKNLKAVRKEFELDLKGVEIVEERIASRADELHQKLEANEVRELEFFENLHAESELQKEKVEERLIGLEQQLNKRFLDLDTQFNSFKGVVVEEVEDLLREVGEVVDARVKETDNIQNKLKFMIAEGQKKYQEYLGFADRFEQEVKYVRDDINDLSVRMDVMSPDVHVSSMNNMVKSMAEYEDHLLALVDSLRTSGVEDNHILEVLVSKGHPKFYATMILKLGNKVRN